MELRPCPFCGGKAQFEQTTYGTDSGMVSLGFKIRCNGCHATSPDGYGKLLIDLNNNGEIRVVTDDRTKAIASWNRRSNND